jgi:hypothetical protein
MRAALQNAGLCAVCAFMIALGPILEACGWLRG